MTKKKIKILMIRFTENTIFNIFKNNRTKWKDFYKMLKDIEKSVTDTTPKNPKIVVQDLKITRLLMT